MIESENKRLNAGFRFYRYFVYLTQLKIPPSLYLSIYKVSRTEVFKNGAKVIRRFTKVFTSGKADIFSKYQLYSTIRNKQYQCVRYYYIKERILVYYETVTSTVVCVPTGVVRGGQSPPRTYIIIKYVNKEDNYYVDNSTVSMYDIQHLSPNIK